MSDAIKDINRLTNEFPDNCDCAKEDFCVKEDFGYCKKTNSTEDCKCAIDNLEKRL